MDRGFTDAEFQQACELVAEASMADFFEYVYTTRELDYNRHLNYAGLELIREQVTVNGENKFNFTIQRLKEMTPQQEDILSSWMH